MPGSACSHGLSLDRVSAACLLLGVNSVSPRCHTHTCIAQRRQQVAHLQHLAANGTPQERARAQEVLAQMQSAQALQQQQQQVRAGLQDPSSANQSLRECPSDVNAQHRIGVQRSNAAH